MIKIYFMIFFICNHVNTWWNLVKLFYFLVSNYAPAKSATWILRRANDSSRLDRKMADGERENFSAGAHP
jgi:hypothetical protein